MIISPDDYIYKKLVLKEIKGVFNSVLKINYLIISILYFKLRNSNYICRLLSINYETLVTILNVIKN